ncbi:hypothetical protein H109_06690 [Trichophyton interdigitale MR816]|uniref:Uncharacterized protein n=1 Tax=Trichophyton interdigitale (strain MR816) TaxID=1215338 RepID=A0A059J0Q9_TRIIM|nr:hypothetical protein H109_06690 [Trichophyton interdigitale MR816]
MGQPARVAQVTPKYDHKRPAKIVEGGEKDGNTTRLDNPQQREDHRTAEILSLEQKVAISIDYS